MDDYKVISGFNLKDWFSGVNNRSENFCRFFVNVLANIINHGIEFDEDISQYIFNEYFFKSPYIDEFIIASLLNGGYIKVLPKYFVGQEYMLGLVKYRLTFVGNGTCVLLNLNDNAVWTGGAKVRDISNITKDEIMEISAQTPIGADANDHLKLVRDKK